MTNADTWSARSRAHGRRDLSWFDHSGLADIADDGKWVLFSDRFGVYCAEPMVRRWCNWETSTHMPTTSQPMASPSEHRTPATRSILPRQGTPHDPAARHNITGYSGARWPFSPTE